MGLFTLHVAMAPLWDQRPLGVPPVGLRRDRLRQRHNMLELAGAENRCHRE